MKVEIESIDAGTEPLHAGAGSDPGLTPISAGASDNLPRPSQRIRGTVRRVRTPSEPPSEVTPPPLRTAPQPLARGILGNTAAAGLMVFGAGFLLGIAARRHAPVGGSARILQAIRAPGRQSP